MIISIYIILLKMNDKHSIRFFFFNFWPSHQGLKRYNCWSQWNIKGSDICYLCGNISLSSIFCPQIHGNNSGYVYYIIYKAQICFLGKSTWSNTFFSFEESCPPLHRNKMGGLLVLRVHTLVPITYHQMPIWLRKWASSEPPMQCLWHLHCQGLQSVFDTTHT